MIPPFKVSKSGVQTDYPLGQTKRPAAKSLDKNNSLFTHKITKNTISINFENNKKSGPIMFNNNYLIISSQCYIHCS